MTANCGQLIWLSCIRTTSDPAESPSSNSSEEAQDSSLPTSTPLALQISHGNGCSCTAAGLASRSYSSFSCSPKLPTVHWRNLPSVSHCNCECLIHANKSVVFEGKDKADQVAAAVEKQVQHSDDSFATNKAGTRSAHVENVQEVGRRTVWSTHVFWWTRFHSTRQRWEL